MRGSTPAPMGTANRLKVAIYLEKSAWTFRPNGSEREIRSINPAECRVERVDSL